MFHVNVNGEDTNPCSGEIDATYAISPPGVATVDFSDEDAESTLAGFDHYWLPQWADGHVIGFDAPEWDVTGAITRVDAVTDQEYYLDDEGTMVTDDLSSFPAGFAFGAGLDAELVSAVFDTGAVRDWGAITATISAGDSATVQFYARAAADLLEVATTPWAGPFDNGDDISAASTTGGRYLQYRIVVRLDDPADAPGFAESEFQLDEFAIAFDTDGDGVDDGDDTGGSTRGKETRTWPRTTSRRTTSRSTRSRRRRAKFRADARLAHVRRRRGLHRRARPGSRSPLAAGSSRGGDGRSRGPHEPGEPPGCAVLAPLRMTVGRGTAPNSRHDFAPSEMSIRPSGIGVQNASRSSDRCPELEPMTNMAADAASASVPRMRNALFFTVGSERVDVVTNAAHRWSLPRGMQAMRRRHGGRAARRFRNCGTSP